MNKEKKACVVTCRYCHTTWKERNYDNEMPCDCCLRMHVYDWSSGEPVSRLAVRKLTPKQTEAFLKKGVDKAYGGIVVYWDGGIKLYAEDLFDDAMQYFAGMSRYNDVPDDKEIDRFVQTGEATPEVRAFVERIVQMKAAIFRENYEYDMLMADEYAFQADMMG